MQQTSSKDANEVQAWKQNSADFQNLWLLLVSKSVKHMESSSCLCEIPLAGTSCLQLLLTLPSQLFQTGSIVWLHMKSSQLEYSSRILDLELRSRFLILKPCKPVPKSWCSHKWALAWWHQTQIIYKTQNLLSFTHWKSFFSSVTRKNLGLVRLKVAFGISLKITTVWWEHRAAAEFTGAS